MEREADLHLVGRLLARIHLRDLLETRLALTGLWSRMETSYEIKQPIFITGMPRSGSTFLHELLSQNPNGRAPRVWEVMFPVAAGCNNAKAARRAIRKTNLRLWWFRRMARQADSICPLRARGPHECVGIHSYTLLSHEFAIMFRVPSYRSFLAATDLTPAYEWQKRFLQHLQKGEGPKAWVLKSPDHVFGLPALFKVFPDARIIQMHRDPLEVLRSCVLMADALQRTFARRESMAQIGVRETRALAEATSLSTRFRADHPELADRFADVNYSELVADPVGTVQRLSHTLDLRLSRDSRERVREIACCRGRYRHSSRLNLRELGLDAETERQRFKPYCLRFGIQES